MILALVASLMWIAYAYDALVTLTVLPAAVIAIVCISDILTALGRRKDVTP